MFRSPIRTRNFTIMENQNENTNLNITQNIHTDNTNQNGNNSTTISKSIKLPQFWTECPQVWFLLVEGQFELHNIFDDNVKFQNVLIALQRETIAKIIDIINPPPLTNKYTIIKKVLIERFSLSEDKRLEQLFSNTELGDRSPSALFRHMKNLTGSESIVSQELLFKLWIRKLPQEIQIHLTSSNIQNINEVITLADKLFGLINKSHFSKNSSIASIETNVLTECIKNLTEITTTIHQNLNKITTDINELQIRSRSKDRNRSNSRDFSRIRNSNNQNYICWYHQKFKHNAFKCIQPCNFNSIKNNQNSKSGSLN